MRSSKRSLRPCSLALPLVTLLGVSWLTDAASAQDPDDIDATSFPQVEQKIKKLKKRVKELETDVGELQALNLPVDADVDCGAGDSVNNVLAAHANGLGQLTIHLTGTCSETITVSRSKVTIRGQGPATVVQPPAGLYSIVIQNGSTEVLISDLRMVGGAGGGIVTKGSYATFSNIVTEQTTIGMAATDNGTLDITGASIHHNTYGLYAVRGGVISASASTIEFSTIGALAFKAGSINLSRVLPDGAGVIVRNNFNGGVARSGGMLELTAVTVENNTSAALYADGNSSLHFFNAAGGIGNTVTSTVPAPAILMQKNTTLVFGDSTNTINGAPIAIQCNADTSYIVPAAGPGTINGAIISCAP